ncbi:hypothetical protein GEMRC1_013590 [Eukaryota sp. GEM-RC1]
MDSPDTDVIQYHLQDLLDKQLFRSALPLAQYLVSIDPSQHHYSALLNVQHHLHAFESILHIIDNLNDSLSSDLIFFRISALFHLKRHKKLIDVLNQHPLDSNHPDYCSCSLLYAKSLIVLNSASEASHVLAKIIVINPFLTEAIDLISSLHLIIPSDLIDILDHHCDVISSFPAISLSSTLLKPAVFGDRCPTPSSLSSMYPLLSNFPSHSAALIRQIGLEMGYPLMVKKIVFNIYSQKYPLDEDFVIYFCISLFLSQEKGILEDLTGRVEGSSTNSNISTFCNILLSLFEDKPISSLLLDESISKLQTIVKNNIFPKWQLKLIFSLVICLFFSNNLTLQSSNIVFVSPSTQVV